MTVKIPCEIYSRVTGYYRPVSQYNPGKKSEFKERKFYEYKTSKDGKKANKETCRSGKN